MRTTARILDAITAANERLISFSQQLRTRAEVIEVRHGMDFRRYSSGTILEFFVDTELTNGKGLCWWLEVNWNIEKWVMESSVLSNEGNGQETVREFPERIAKTVDDVVMELDEAVSLLTGSIDCLDLAYM